MPLIFTSTVHCLDWRVNLRNMLRASKRHRVKPFAIGHSFFCAGPAGDEGEAQWYARIIRTEIAPLLREYWFDAPAKAEQWTDHLLAAV